MSDAQLMHNCARLEARNAELEKEVARLKTDIEFVTNARIQDAKDAETNCKQFNYELRQQLASNSPAPS